MEGVIEINKRKVRLFIEAVWNDGRLELIDELVAADYAGHGWQQAGQVRGREGVRRFVASCRRAHPGIYIKIEDQIAEEDRVVTRWHVTRSVSEAAGVPAPSCSGISIIRLLAGKQVDSYTECTSLERGAIT